MIKFIQMALAALLLYGMMSQAFGQKKEISTPDFPSGEEGLAQMIDWLMEASDKERKAFSTKLLPKEEDYQVVFEEGFAKRVQRYHKRLKRQYNLIIKPHRKNQTEYVYWVTTSEELVAYTGDARNFPGGYKEIARYFLPGLTLYRFKFIKPGMRLGSAYDVLIFVNGQWRLFPRPWVMSDELARY